MSRNKDHADNISCVNEQKWYLIVCQKRDETLYNVYDNDGIVQNSS